MAFGDLLAKLSSGERLSHQEEELLRLMGNQLDQQSGLVNGLTTGQSVAENLVVRDVSFLRSPLATLSARIASAVIADDTSTAVEFDFVYHPSDQFYIDPDDASIIRVVNKAAHVLVCGEVEWVASSSSGNHAAFLYTYFVDGTTYFQWLYELVPGTSAFGTRAIPFASVSSAVPGDSPVSHLRLFVTQQTGVNRTLAGGVVSFLIC